jgi:hypothetical protein
VETKEYIFKYIVYFRKDLLDLSIASEITFTVPRLKFAQILATIQIPIPHTAATHRKMKKSNIVNSLSVESEASFDAIS